MLLGRFLGDVDFKCLTFKPSASYNGYSRRVLSYTNDTQTVNYYNCLFLKTSTAPTMGYFCVHTIGTTFTNKNFYNCSFDGSVSINALCGKVFAKNCAIYNSTAGETNEEDNLTSATFDTEYNVTNGDNSLYGVYSGEYSWSGGKSEPTMIWDGTSVPKTNVATYTDNPLKVSVTNARDNSVRTNIPLGTGKYYMEFTVVSGTSGFVGICNENFDIGDWGNGSWENVNQVSFYCPRYYIS